MKAPQKEILVEGIDYQYEFDMKNSKDEKTIPVRIKSGEFKDVIISYGELSFKDDEDSDILSFEYHILESKEHKNLKENVDFLSRIGDILVSIIETALERSEEIERKTGGNNHSGINNE